MILPGGYAEIFRFNCLDVRAFVFTRVCFYPPVACARDFLLLIFIFFLTLQVN